MQGGTKGKEILIIRELNPCMRFTVVHGWVSNGWGSWSRGRRIYSVLLGRLFIWVCWFWIYLSVEVMYIIYYHYPYLSSSLDKTSKPSNVPTGIRNYSKTKHSFSCFIFRTLACDSCGNKPRWIRWLTWRRGACIALGPVAGAQDEIDQLRLD